MKSSSKIPRFSKSNPKPSSKTSKEPSDIKSVKSVKSKQSFNKSIDTSAAALNKIDNQPKPTKANEELSKLPSQQHLLMMMNITILLIRLLILSNLHCN